MYFSSTSAQTAVTGLIVAALLAGCESHSSRRPTATEPPVATADAEAATVADTSNEAPQPANQPDAGDAATTSPYVGLYRCERVLHSLVDFHRGTLELRGDGRFSLHHVNTAPEGGWSTHMEGPWHVEGQTLVFVPETGLRRRWRGDEHRHQHGEDVPYTTGQEPLYQSPRRVPITGDAAGRLSFSVPELGATFYREVDGQPPPPCSEERPMPF